jgi:hypothetical protein
MSERASVEQLTRRNEGESKVEWDAADAQLFGQDQNLESRKNSCWNFGVS